MYARSRRLPLAVDGDWLFYSVQGASADTPFDAYAANPLWANLAVIKADPRHRGGRRPVVSQRRPDRRPHRPRRLQRGARARLTSPELEAGPRVRVAVEQRDTRD
jgi:hypothetical protein